LAAANLDERHLNPYPRLPVVALSPTAAREIRRLQALRGQPESCLRLRAAPGGCADWHYVFELVAAPEPGDRTYSSEGVAIAVEAASEPYLRGLRLDYAEDLMGGGFRFQNPAAIATCSCGHSFTVKADSPPS